VTKVWIRQWIEKDLEDIEKHIIIVGELASDCGVCKEIGLDVRKVRKCPHCGTEFKYVTTRLTGGAAGHQRFFVIGRIRDKCPDLIFVDYDDYKKLISKSKAEEFLRGND